MNRYEVAVVGGGIAGTSVAFFLAERTSVVVLEREATLGVHATGRSAAVFTECYGDAVVRRLAIASREFLEHPPEGFTAEALVSPRGILFVADSEQADRLAPAAEEQQTLVANVRLVDAADAVRLCPVLDPGVVAGGVFEPDAMDLDVHALHLGYQQGLRRRGGEIRTSWGLESGTRDGDEWVLRSADEEIRARVVVDAGGAWCDVVAAACGVSEIGLVPKRRTAFTFFPPAGVDHHVWPMVIDLDEQWYFKPDGPLLLASPADAVPVEPHDVRHREVDVAIGIERIEAMTTLAIRSVRSAWAGLRSFVADEVPLNGWDDDVEGFYWLAGQGGFGIKTSPAMGRYAASMILEGQPPADLTARGLDPAALGVKRLHGG